MEVTKMQEAERKSSFENLKEKYGKTSDDKEKETILNDLSQLARDFEDWQKIMGLCFRTGFAIKKRAAKEMAELAKNYLECAAAFRFATWTNIGAAMTALGKISYMYEAGELGEREQRAYYGMCAWADSLSGKIPNA
jgi:Ribonuclease G/E